MSPEDTIYQEALNAIHNGEKTRARDLLTRLIRAEKDNAQFWLQMSAVVESAKERIFCLNEVLRLEPANLTARRGLIYLGVNPPDETLAIPLQNQRRNWEAALFGGAAPEKALQRARLNQILMVVGALVLLVAIAATILLNLNPPKTDFVFENPFPTATLGPSPTPALTASPVGRTATPTRGPLPPLAALLQSTYTPTPLSVNTPHPRTEAYRSAISAYNRADWSSAASYFQQVATIEPTAADVFYLLGEVYRNQNKLKEALQAYDQAIKINPGFAPAYLGRARARQAQSAEPADPIRADLEKAITLDPGFGEAYLDLAALKMRKKESKDLQRDLDFATNLLPDNVQAFVLRAQYYLAQGKPAPALEDAQRAYELDITQLTVYRVLGEAYRANKRSAESIQPLEIYTRYKEDEFEPFLWLAQAYQERGAEGDLQLALRALESAIGVNKLNHDAYIQRGTTYLDLKQGKEAMADFVTASMLRADSFPSMLGRGRAMLLLEDGPEAYNFFSKALPLAGNNAERAAAYYWRALGLEQMKLVPSALADWEALLRLPAAEIPALYRQAALQHAQSLATVTPTSGAAVPTRTSTASPGASSTPTPP